MVVSGDDRVYVEEFPYFSTNLPSLNVSSLLVPGFKMGVILVSICNMFMQSILEPDMGIAVYTILVCSVERFVNSSLSIVVRFM